MKCSQCSHLVDTYYGFYPMKNYPVSENWHKLHAHRYFARALNTHLPGAAEEWNANDENRMKKKWLFAGIIKTIYGNLFDYNVSWNDGELSFTPFNNEWWWFSYLKPVRSIMCAYCTIDSTLCVFMPVPKKKLMRRNSFFVGSKEKKTPRLLFSFAPTTWFRWKMDGILSISCVFTANFKALTSGYY